jgi:hypothetical protein
MTDELEKNVGGAIRPMWNRLEPPWPHTHYVWDSDETCPLGWVPVCRRCEQGPLAGEDEALGVCHECFLALPALDADRVVVIDETHVHTEETLQEGLRRDRAVSDIGGYGVWHAEDEEWIGFGASSGLAAELIPPGPGYEHLSLRPVYVRIEDAEIDRGIDQ